jgi:hypothetical protein
MRAVIQAAIRQGGGGADTAVIGDDDNAAGRRLGAARAAMHPSDTP